MRKPKTEKGETALEEKREMKKGMKKGGGVPARHHYARGGTVGNEGERVKERHEERTNPQVRQDPREGREEGENANFYENMIHHGEGGMLAPGEAPLTVGPGVGSKAPAKERLRAAGTENP